MPSEQLGVLDLVVAMRTLHEKFDCVQVTASIATPDTVLTLTVTDELLTIEDTNGNLHLVEGQS
jgi:hypothetical protein